MAAHVSFRHPNGGGTWSRGAQVSSHPLIGLETGADQSDVCSMSQASDYRKHEEDARKQAEMASRSEDQAMWLKIAEQWFRLANQAENQGSMW